MVTKVLKWHLACCYAVTGVLWVVALALLMCCDSLFACCCVVAKVLWMGIMLGNYVVAMLS